MRKHKLWAGLAGLALLVTMALADNNVLNHGTYYSNAPTGLKADGTTGNLAISEQFKDRDKVVSYNDIINDTCAVGMADSTVSPFDVHDVRRGFLYIRVTPAAAAGATPFTRLAVRITGNTNGIADSLNSYNFVPRLINVTSGTTLAADSLVYGDAANLPTSVAFAGTEFVVIIPADAGAAVKWSRPNTAIIPLVDARGIWFWAENMSVMVRNLGPGAGVPVVRVSYRGSPL